MALKTNLLGAVRRRTFSCCRNAQISASSAARDRIRSTTIQPMSLQRSLIPQQHRPIRRYAASRIGLRQGQLSVTISVAITVNPAHCDADAIRSDTDADFLGTNL